MYTSWRVVVLTGALMGCVEQTPTPTGVEFLDARDALAVGSPAEIVTAGRAIYGDANLSRNRNQACATCHSGAWGFAGPGDASWPTYQGGFAFYSGSFNGITTPTARFGGRKPPSAAYAHYSPTLAWVAADNAYKGGLFWDGRATGNAVVGPDNGMLLAPVEQQALGPFQAGPEHAFSQVCVLHDVRQSSYAGLFNAASGIDLNTLAWTKVEEWVAKQIDQLAAKGVRLADPLGQAAPIPVLDRWCHTPTENQAHEALLLQYPALSPALRDAFALAYSSVGYLLGRFEASDEVNPHSSRYDTGAMTSAERAGEALFFGEAGCAFCHATPAPAIGAPIPTRAAQQFSDFSYYNLGLPKNPSHPNGAGFTDRGLGAFLATTTGATFLKQSGQPATNFDGFFRTVTVRNVDKRLAGGAKTYMHNGSLNSLELVVHFYNTRDLKACRDPLTARVNATYTAGLFPRPGKSPRQDFAEGRCWPAPEFPATVIRDLVAAGLPADLPGVTPRGPVGNIGLSTTEESRLVAFLRALTDR
jgi:cytochrome c peroxidase